MNIPRQIFCIPKDALTKDAVENYTSFDINVVAEGDRGKMVSNEKKLDQKLKIAGVKIVWVKAKSKKIPIILYMKMN